jgi:hypothetical protein
VIFILIVTFFLFVVDNVDADSQASIVVPGELQADVVDKLGEPTGKMRNKYRTIWLYSKGTVEFENGKVVRSDFMSDVKYAEDQAKRAKLAEAKHLAEMTAGNTIQSSQTAKPVAPSDPMKQGVNLESITTRFVRPFIRPVYENVQYYNNIPIVFEVAKWPPAMRQVYDVSVEIPVETGQRRTTFETLPYELKKYPAEMLEQTLRCIYMIRDIRGGGEKNNPAGIAFYTEGIVLEHTYMLHHEVAHILNFLFQDVFPGKEITAVSGEYKGFDHDRNLYFKELWALGYTSNYAMSSVGEDFAEFCSDLYLQPVAIFAAMKENSKLQEKFNIIRPFLEMVKRRTTGDTTPMDETYFARFDRNCWKP